MRLIIGGRFQGKLSYAKERYGLTCEEIFICTADGPYDRGKKCLYGYEQYVEYCIRNGIGGYCDVPDGCIVIFNDIFCGVVPVDGGQRLLREECGRCVTALARKAESVERVFCGIAKRIK